ncbi:MAG: guanylate kinase [Armatimonadetes bacterium]|nr:guanylate kinase [Armatimonadota bacterium]
MIGRLVILSGPSGVGKDSVIDQWRACNPLVERVVAYTTRAPREGEVEGVDYHFVSLPQFMKIAEDGGFLEFKRVHDNLYGTPIAGVDAILGRGGIAVLKIDVEGAMDVMHARPDAASVFILPPSMEELERRIRGRNSDTDTVITQRLKNAEKEIEKAEFYQKVLINDDIDEVVEALEDWLMPSLP